MAPEHSKTTALTVRGQTYFIRRFAVTVHDGPDRGLRAVSSSDEFSVGTEKGNDLQLSDTAVSRHHLLIRVTKHGLEVRDQSSTNGTLVGDLGINSVLVRRDTRLALGRSSIDIEFLDEQIEEPLAESDHFGDLYGRSSAMRRLYPVLEKYARSDSTLLVTGETGTGKEVVAESVHLASPRSRGPLVVVDCGALPRQLMESELFGHVRGSFTGAEDDRDGAFATADGGTLFLDEIGELALDLQPVLLRVLESRRFRPVGSSQEQKSDVRVIAATNRDLRTEVNERRFRADLFFRLNVLNLKLPPLREREGDVVLLAERFWSGLRPGVALPKELASELALGRWPGNIRELRNAVERAALLETVEPTSSDELGSFADAKDGVISRFERDYLFRLLTHTGGNLARAARISKMSRSHLRMVMHKRDLVRDDFLDEAE